jgi:hypothetical protein
LPTIIRRTRVADTLWVGILTAIPYTCAIIALPLLGSSADRRRERRLHLAIPMLVSAAGFATLPMLGSVGASIVCVSVAAAGILVSSSLFWALPTAVIGGDGTQSHPCLQSARNSGVHCASAAYYGCALDTLDARLDIRANRPGGARHFAWARRVDECAGTHPPSNTLTMMGQRQSAAGSAPGSRRRQSVFLILCLTLSRFMRAHQPQVLAHQGTLSLFYAPVYTLHELALRMTVVDEHTKQLDAVDKRVSTLEKQVYRCGKFASRQTKAKTW